MEGTVPPGGGTGVQPNEASQLGEGKSIDWDKVGKLYKPESAVEHIVSQEMKRLNVGMGLSLNNQDIDIEERAKNKKK